jgi:TonB-dependent starch-binding outer membrane protein SusC
MKHYFQKFSKKMSLFLLAVVFTATAWAQQRSISGTVTDETGQPLPGVTVVVEGTTIGTVSNGNGEYTLSVPEDAVNLTFSFVGMKTVNVSINNRSVINLSMELESIGVDEVVVVGYGTQRKANLTGAVSSVNFSELESRPAANTSALLQGQMSGVQVSTFRNQPGEDDPEIRVRGVGTLNSGSNPLVIVDGIESNLSQIPASDIESVSVLKDAASAAIYGVRAANGVILVTTKRGKGAKPVVNIRQNFSWQQALVKPDLVDSWDWANIMNLDLTEQGQNPLYTDAHIQAMKDGSQPDYWANTDWFDELYSIAPMNTTYLSVSGSNENVRYMVSTEYLDQEGIMMGTSQERYNFRSNIDIFATDKIKFGMNLAGNKRDITETLNDASATGSDNDLNYSIRRFARPTVPVKYSNGEWGQVDGLYYEPGSTVGGSRNVVELAQLGENINEIYNFQGKIFAEIEFIKNLKYRPSFSYVYNSNIRSRFSPTRETYDAEGNVLSEDVHNTLMNNNTTWKRYQVDNLLTYGYTTGSHSVNVLLGQSAQMFRTDFFRAYVEDFPNNNIRELDGGINNKDVSGSASELSLDSYFGRVNYNYDDKYLAEFNYRYDGTSRFHEDQRWGGFPSFSLGWVPSNESFLSNLGPISFLKLRGSWGQLGNQNIGGSYYPYTQNINTGQNYLWGDKIAPGVAVTSLANQNLTWETTTITDIGVDLNLFKNKIQIVADWFDKTSTDILIRLPIPSTMGNVAAPFQNVGEVNNKGWELDVKYQDAFGDVRVFGGFNLSHVKNKVVDYGGIESSISNNAITIEGHPIGSYYAYVAEGYYQTQEELDNAPQQFGRPLRLGDVKYKDISGPDGVPDGRITANYDREIIGNPFPDLQYSFNLGASYKGFDIYTFFQGIEGIYRYHWINTEANGQGSFTKIALDYWTEDNRNAPTPRWGNLGNNTQYSTFWLKDASYLRLKNLEVGYTLPSDLTNKVNINKARIYFSGINLLTWTELDDYDPEKLTGDDRNRDYPKAKVYSVGINVTF